MIMGLVAYIPSDFVYFLKKVNYLLSVTVYSTAFQIIIVILQP